MIVAHDAHLNSGLIAWKHELIVTLDRAVDIANPATMPTWLFQTYDASASLRQRPSIHHTNVEVPVIDGGMDTLCNEYASHWVLWD